jgi:hypothetical protein
MSGSWDTKQAIRLGELCQEGVLWQAKVGGGVKHTGISPRLCSEPDGGALVDGTFLRSAARFAIKGGI